MADSSSGEVPNTQFNVDAPIQLLHKADHYGIPYTPSRITAEQNKSFVGVENGIFAVLDDIHKPGIDVLEIVDPLNSAWCIGVEQIERRCTAVEKNCYNGHQDCYLLIVSPYSLRVV